MSFRNAWQATSAVLLIAACEAQGPFNDAELNVIRVKLGELPDEPPVDPTNLYADDPAAAALGRALFFDARYSANGQVACSTCHEPASGFQDARDNTSLGLGRTSRHAPTIINAAFGHSEMSPTNWHFWDGRADSQWSQALGPAENDVEMGSSRAAVAYLIYDHYREAYEEIFGAMPQLRDASGAALYPERARPGTPEWDELSLADQKMLSTIYAGFGKAIAAYERKIVSRDSRLDAFVRDIAAGAEDSDVLTDQEKRGLRVFMGKGACIQCHDGPNLTDWKFHNIGLSQAGESLPASDRGRQAAIEVVTASEFNCAGPFSDHPDKDSCEVLALAAKQADVGAFKTPGLRDISRTAPYMHTGTLMTLEDVVDHYDRGGDGGGFSGEIDKKIRMLGLSDSEKAALVAFLKTLDGSALDEELTQAPEMP